ncbi:MULTISPECIES: hypothetical protein [Streptomyces]|uniref:YtxH domain-containing protein n=1 Tax=Streptomyces cacaoi TaxID=1898 RepID=A0A4Y3R2E1_STRCI|nr:MULTISPECIES: hypothetical protein [Streptomyces]NNG86621.1 YtxH domain-containing protein [Streptomyces cacaoi]QHF93621.1 hypothetical protein DEH18_06750 [Streptomyces sp. NHF165]GEB51087.1 hypothetical protein SCA03_36380 [Streptomyces cacaoi]
MRYRLAFVAGVVIGYVLGTRAGRERYEQLRKGARRMAENPAVRNMGEAAVLGGRQAASRAAEAVGDRLPAQVSDRLRTVRGQRARVGSEWGEG